MEAKVSLTKLAAIVRAALDVPEVVVRDAFEATLRDLAVAVVHAAGGVGEA